jgi:hypothetical protein
MVIPPITACGGLSLAAIERFPGNLGAFGGKPVLASKSERIGPGLVAATVGGVCQYARRGGEGVRVVWRAAACVAQFGGSAGVSSVSAGVSDVGAVARGQRGVSR